MSSESNRQLKEFGTKVIELTDEYKSLGYPAICGVLGKIIHDIYDLKPEDYE